MSYQFWLVFSKRNILYGYFNRPTPTPSEVGCGEERQCIWLPYPHHIDPWCAGVDFLNDIDYRGMTARGLVRAADAVTISTADHQPGLFPAGLQQTRHRGACACGGNCGAAGEHGRISLIVGHASIVRRCWTCVDAAELQHADRLHMPRRIASTSAAAKP